MSAKSKTVAAKPGKRVLIHHAQTAKAKSLATLAGHPHLHFCSNRECRLVYEDACDDIATNGRCHSCRGVRRPIWMAARDPRECCLGNCEQVLDAKQLVHYNLAGPGPWYQCRTCARAHGWPCQ
jgi:hypothetical protein